MAIPEGEQRNITRPKSPACRGGRNPTIAIAFRRRPSDGFNAALNAVDFGRHTPFRATKQRNRLVWFSFRWR